MSERNGRTVSELVSGRQAIRGRTSQAITNWSMRLWQQFGTAVLGGTILLAGPGLGGQSVLHAQFGLPIISDVVDVVLGTGDNGNVSPDQNVVQEAPVQVDSVPVDDGIQRTIIDPTFNAGDNILTIDQSFGAGNDFADQQDDSDGDFTPLDPTQPVPVTLYDGRQYTLPNLAAAQKYVSQVNANPNWRASIGTKVPAIRPSVIKPKSSVPVIAKPNAKPIITNVRPQTIVPMNHTPVVVQTTNRPTTTYKAPVQTNRVPVQTYHAPVQAYHAPVQTYHAPVQTYHAPVQTYHAPVNTYRPSMPSYRTPSYSGFRR